MISATMNELREQALEPHAQQLKVNSPVYVGGIPPEIQSFYRELGLEQGKMTPRRTCVFKNWCHAPGGHSVADSLNSWMCNMNFSSHPF